ncbi:MAG: hypothetical protein KDA96_18160 [Planctomycetaceae bacterium]|nr:hypothetical protein [Planctomycetaceae bacterium]
MKARNKKKSRKKDCNCHSRTAANTAERGVLRSKALNLENLLDQIRGETTEQSVSESGVFSVADLMRLARANGIRITLEPCSPYGPSPGEPTAES